jgi:DNA-binding response OmpR family regulator
MSTPSNVRILVVDDDLDIAEILTDVLRRQGYDVRMAPNAEAAILELVTFWPELAIIDIGLPDIDGYELAVRIRAVTDCKLVALSGYGAHSAPSETVVTSFDRHLVKPVDHAVLCNTIDALAACVVRD